MGLSKDEPREAAGGCQEPKARRVAWRPAGRGRELLCLYDAKGLLSSFYLSLNGSPFRGLALCAHSRLLPRDTPVCWSSVQALSRRTNSSQPQSLEKILDPIFTVIQSAVASGSDKTCWSEGGQGTGRQVSATVQQGPLQGCKNFLLALANSIVCQNIPFLSSSIYLSNMLYALATCQGLSSGERRWIRRYPCPFSNRQWGTISKVCWIPGTNKDLFNSRNKSVLLMAKHTKTLDFSQARSLFDPSSLYVALAENEQWGIFYIPMLLH